MTCACSAPSSAPNMALKSLARIMSLGTYRRPMKAPPCRTDAGDQNAIFAMRIFITLSPTFERKRMGPLMEGDFRSM